MTRQLDPADRPLSVSYSTDASLTTTYAYDTSPTAGTAPIGRLSSISKGTGATATDIAYTYDLFGRTLQDGALAYTYDLNGNRASIAYPGGVTACYFYDIVDRQDALSYSTANGAGACQGATLPIVTSSPAPTIYLADGPLQTLNFANGLTETHAFDQRYHPTAISVGTLLSLTYSTDAVGNITAIAPGRAFSYQDFQYFLTVGTGPWGTRAWSYDSIGNRLTETRGSSVTDSYTYLTNSASPRGDTPLLKSVALASNIGTRIVTLDPIGNFLQQSSPSAQLDFSADPASKLIRIGDDVAHTTSTLLYDGRGFLASATNAQSDCGPLVTLPVYSSDGILYYRQQQSLFTGTISSQTRLFYFGGRPVAQLDGLPLAGTLTFLAVDHLGTPYMSSGAAGLVAWTGGFEPFGRDYTTPSALRSGIFLRLPGQWDDPSWDNSQLQSNIYYNLNRWYAPQAGTYEEIDPLTSPPLWIYAYAQQNPLIKADPLGLYTAAGNSGIIETAMGLLRASMNGNSGRCKGCKEFFDGLGLQPEMLLPSGSLPYIYSNGSPLSQQANVYGTVLCGKKVGDSNGIFIDHRLVANASGNADGLRCLAAKLAHELAHYLRNHCSPRDPEGPEGKRAEQVCFGGIPEGVRQCGY
jgi:RHS repeat-associated protein